MNDEEPCLAFVGTYSSGSNDSLFTYRVDRETGDLTLLNTTQADENPSFLAIHPDGEYLYVINEVTDGKVAAYSIDHQTGALSLLNRQSSGDAGPCYCSVDATGTCVMIAHYVGGSVSVLSIRSDGALDEPTTVVEHEGASVDPERQTQPHPHSIAPGPENRFVYVPDLGTDRIHTYELDLESCTLHPADPPAVSLHEGAGPRHFDIHPQRRVLYLLNELDATLTTFDYDPEMGTLVQRGTTDTLPAEFDDDNLAADIHVHPSGRQVYVSNRGHDSIAVIELDNDGGITGRISHVPTRGACPRNFAFDPSGTFLFAANRESDAINVFRVDAATGELEYTGNEIDVHQPSCMKVVAPR